MAVQAAFYGLAVQKMVSGTINLGADTVKTMLVGNGYTVNQDTDAFRSIATTTEVAQGGANSGYTTGGMLPGNGTVTYDAATNQVRWTHANPSWVGTFTASKMVWYKSRGGAATADEVIMYADFGGDQSVTAGTFTYQVPATGTGIITVGTQE